MKVTFEKVTLPNIKLVNSQANELVYGDEISEVIS